MNGYQQHLKHPDPLREAFDHLGLQLALTSFALGRPMSGDVSLNRVSSADLDGTMSLFTEKVAEVALKDGQLDSGIIQQAYGLVVAGLNHAVTERIGPRKPRSIGEAILRYACVIPVPDRQIFEVMPTTFWDENGTFQVTLRKKSLVPRLGDPDNIYLGRHTFVTFGMHAYGMFRDTFDQQHR